MSFVKAIPVAQYLRMSTEHQRYSLQNQDETNRAYANSHGYEVVKTYCDVGRSGVLLKGRPELMQLLTDVIRGDVPFRAVLVYDVSRWGRFQDCDEGAHYEFICRSVGVPVLYCAESFINDNTLQSSIVKALKRTMAAEYSRELGEKAFAGCRRLAELGFKQGGTAGYGLRRLMISADGQQKRVMSRGEVKSLKTDRVILIPGPEDEVQCVREMYHMVVNENRTPYYIAGELNRRGVDCPERKWRVARVSRILTDPKYAGYNVWNRTSKRLGRPTVQVPRTNWLLCPRAFKPVPWPSLRDFTEGVWENAHLQRVAGGVQESGRDSQCRNLICCNDLQSAAPDFGFHTPKGDNRAHTTGNARQVGQSGTGASDGLPPAPPPKPSAHSVPCLRDWARIRQGASGAARQECRFVEMYRVP